ncbi:MAG: AAA family ATPase [Sulfurospirillaceae bacterium]|nr:AAA family ATPase [Sulfurospirillaceae bacterium]MCK9546190.1 AAA family ATPase [Sulfurospirillaceae bacterium]
MKRIFKSQKLMISIMALSIVIGLLGFSYLKNRPVVIDLKMYETLLEAKAIKKAKIFDNEVILTTNSYKYSVIKDGVNLKELLNEVPVSVAKESGLFQDIIILTLFLGAIFGFGYYLRKENEKNKIEIKQRNQAFELETLMPSRITPAISNLKFKDVAGIDGVKEELSEIVDFLKNPKKYKEYGIRLPKGVLLIGPPGVGKTMIAKAVAGEANVPFFYQSGASFVQIYVGMGAKRVRELFSRAKSYSPSIIFIDEIDAVGKARGGFRNDEREATLNQLLTEIDGFEDSSGVIVIAATNRLEMIDEALLRSGRFDRRIFLPMPDLEDRKRILEIYLKGKPSSVDIEDVAKISVGFSGAALATLVNEAAINALRNNKEEVTFEDFQAVREKVLLGKRKVLTYSEEEKKIQASYQAAKALSAYWFEVDFDKITITHDRVKEIDREIESKTQILNKIKVYLAGTAATTMLFNEKFSNSKDDLIHAKELAEKMIGSYGMGEFLLPQGNDVTKVLEDALKEVESFLEGLKEPLELITKELLEKESITKEKLKEIVKNYF